MESGLAPSDDLESAILTTLEPGAYTAIVRGSDGSTGVGLVEIYDLDGAAISRTGQHQYPRLGSERVTAS